jgi:hypothetical protein
MITKNKIFDESRDCIIITVVSGLPTSVFGLLAKININIKPNQY